MNTRLYNVNEVYSNAADRGSIFLYSLQTCMYRSKPEKNRHCNFVDKFPVIKI